MAPRVTLQLLILLLGVAGSALSLAGEPRLAHKDFTLVAGKPRPKDCYQELVRVEKSGHAVFRLEQDGPVIVRAAAGQQIPEGDSDSYGFVRRVDIKREMVVIRVYDLGKQL